MAGVAGPMVVALIRDRTGGYEGAFPVFAGLLLLALVTSLAMRVNLRRIRRRGGVAFAEG
jgi:OFA family oxalate/formate antiporter-like MFS transporter